MKHKLLLSVASLLALVGFGVATRPSPALPVQVHSTASAAKLTCQPDTVALLSSINGERESLGVKPLVVDSSLVSSSQNKLNDEIAQKYYGHDSPNGDSWARFVRAQAVTSAASEDLNENALSASSDWISLKNSPAHYASLTDAQYTRVGLTSQCTNFFLVTGTGPDDNSNLVGRYIGELTVIHLAAPETSGVGGTLCNDGWASPSTGNGTCSSHMGESH